MYQKGEGVEKDEKKAWYHAEEAAIGGHPVARHRLAQIEMESGRYDRMAKHIIIAAKLGHDESMEVLKEFYATTALVCKEDLAAALRGYQAAVDATKSKQREEAKAYEKRQMKKLIK